MVRISTFVLLCASTVSHAALASVVTSNNAATVVQTLARRQVRDDSCGEICTDGSCCPKGFLCSGRDGCVQDRDAPSPTETIIVTMKPRPSAGQQDSGGGGLGRDAIIGIVVGSVVAACAIGYCIYLALMRRKPAREPGARQNPADQENVIVIPDKTEENGYTVQQQHDAQGLMAGHKESGYTNSGGAQGGFPENDSRQPHYIASDDTAYIAPVQQPSSPVHQDSHAQHWNQQHNPQLAPLQTQFPQQQRPVEPPRQSTYSDVSQPTPPMFQGQFQNEPPRQSTYSDVSNASPSQPQPQSQYQAPQPFQPTYQSDPSHYHQHQSTPSPQPAVRQQTNRQSSYEYYQQQNQQQQQQYQQQGPAGQYQAFQPPPPSQYAQQGPASPIQQQQEQYIPDGLRVGSPVAPYRGDQHGLIPVASDQQHGQGR